MWEKADSQRRMMGDQVLATTWDLIIVLCRLWGSREGGGNQGIVPGGAQKPTPNARQCYLPVTVPMARTEPLGWKPAERAGS